MVTELREFVIDPCIWLKLKTFHLNTIRGLNSCENIIVKILKISKEKNHFKLNNFCFVGSKL
jgi:hypothetical protein